ncbi:uncharacterized protein LOC136031181 [Artemia franciscana]|uniref:C2H2-type domain-containing protein n=1 Tax=Artemia franciscana TaxID=6661 RepID=A0AA88KSS4_ARTSF|nr:hypothetical protein QYM36_017295 [Artemia franciscana]
MESKQKMMNKKPFEYYIFKLEKDSIIPSENGLKKNQRFRCDICNAIFKRGFSLKRHYLRFHINVIYINERDLANCGITPTETTETGLYKCHDCSTHFDFKEELMDHRNSYHINGRKPGGVNYFCDRCSMTFTNKHNFLSHVKRACQTEDVKVCPHCQKEYARKGRLEKHMLHCKTECKKLQKSDNDLHKMPVLQAIAPEEVHIDEESKSIESIDGSDNNSRSSLINDFHHSLNQSESAADQDSVMGLPFGTENTFDLGQNVERYVRDADNKVYLVLDSAKVVYPSSDRPYDDPGYYETDYPFILDDSNIDVDKPQESDEPSLTWQELKFSADSESQDVFIRVRAAYVDNSNGAEALRPYSHTAGEKSGILFITENCTPVKVNSNITPVNAQGLKSETYHNDRPKVDLSQIFNLINANDLNIIETTAPNCHQERNVDDGSEPKRPKTEGRKTHLFRSRHTCPECGKSFGKSGQMISHRRLAHGSDGVKTTIYSFSKSNYLPLWSPNRDELDEPPHERTEQSLDFVNLRCSENNELFIDGKLTNSDCADTLCSLPFVCADRLSWKRHKYLDLMTEDKRNQFLSDMIMFPLAEQFLVHSKLNCDTFYTPYPFDVLSSVGLLKKEKVNIEQNSQGFEGIWSLPMCFICRACGYRSKYLSNYLSHQNYSHPLIFPSHMVLYMDSSEVPKELWSDWAFGRKMLRASLKKKGRKRLRSLATLAQNINIVTTNLAEISAKTKSKRARNSFLKACTKCETKVLSLLELHSHIVECGEKLQSARISPPQRHRNSESRRKHSIKGRRGMKRKIPSNEDLTKRKSGKRKHDDFVLDHGSNSTRRITRSQLKPDPTIQKEANQVQFKDLKSYQGIDCEPPPCVRTKKVKPKGKLLFEASGTSNRKPKVESTPLRYTRSSSKLKTPPALATKNSSQQDFDLNTLNVAKRNILTSLSVSNNSAFPTVKMEPMQFLACPNCSQTFLKNHEFHKHFENCAASSPEAQTLEITVSRGHSTDFRSIQTQTLDYIDLDTALTLADANHVEVWDKDKQFMQETSSAKDTNKRQRPHQFKMFHGSTSKSILGLSIEKRLHLGNKLQLLIDNRRKDDDEFDSEMLAVLQSLPEKSLYLALCCPICLRRYKYRLKFRRHLIQGLINGCVQPKTALEKDLPENILSLFQGEEYCTSLKVKKLSNKLAHIIHNMIQNAESDCSVTWALKNIGSLPSVEDIETLIQRSDNTEIQSFFSQSKLHAFSLELILERNKISQTRRKRKTIRDTLPARPKSAPISSSQKRRKSDNMPDLLNLSREARIDDLLEKELGAIILQQKYLNEPPMHSYSPDMYPGLQLEPRPLSEPCLYEQNNDVVIAMLEPIKVEPNETVGDSGYFSGNNSIGSFVDADPSSFVPIDYPMPRLLPFQPIISTEEDESLQTAYDSPPVLECPGELTDAHYGSWSTDSLFN